MDTPIALMESDMLDFFENHGVEDVLLDWDDTARDLQVIVDCEVCEQPWDHYQLATCASAKAACPWCREGWEEMVREGLVEIEERR